MAYFFFLFIPSTIQLFFFPCDVQVLDAQEEVLRKERELEEARVKLAAIRKAKYKDRPAGTSHEGSPDATYYSDF